MTDLGVAGDLVVGPTTGHEPDGAGPDHAARAARRSLVPETGAALARSPFRVDRDRIVASPFFARLAGVTQVVSPTGSGLLVHNRLTHSLQVAQVGRAIAERLTADATTAAVLDRLGGLDADVVEAAALAHDLGHPPFGHLGEQVLDRLGRDQLGLPDGFEGNAQSFRIVTTIDLHGPGGTGLDLTAAVRAAVLKYPWARRGHPDPHPSAAALPPRGGGPLPGAPDAGSAKFSAYSTELDDLRAGRGAFGAIGPWQQTVEAAVMDLADDIAYAIHDLEDFHRVGVLQQAGVAAELRGWQQAGSAVGGDRPGAALERLRRRLENKDGWAYDAEAFAAAVERVRTELADGLLASSFDGSMAAERAVAEFSARWTARLVGGVRVLTDPPVRSAHVALATEQWHEVAVLKFVHHRFVLQRADLASHQRGQATVLAGLVGALHDWLAEDDSETRKPPRLRDLVELARGEFAAFAPAADVERLARGRAVVDYVASLTDGQATALLDVLTGRSARLWTDAAVL
ncbi:deoxyguanosinetriphosphate triphosphohydrolase family protein [Pseudonocardia alaniniphila]|uniref:DNTP triphosphohydrolase n=2 Tax=Pseudonocardia alaniniphila TaxID=75291 RepID=A0ABS9TGQ3_9PSEU|nr:dNTP triphosphohydrolase [Pseudonocardia alaniniphila]MCH6167722.1 dNTP triphosphohydrolase [Pseudonocardia alaniniphila]